MTVDDPGAGARDDREPTRRPPERRLPWRLLRTLLPRWYRRRFAESLLRTHVDRVGGEAGARGPGFWGAVTADVVLTAVQARLPRRSLWSRGSATLADVLHPTDWRMEMTWSELVFESSIMARSLLRRPGYSAAATLTLGLGVGVAASIFSLVHGSLLRPLPYPEPDRLVQIRDFYEPTSGSGGMSVPNFADLRESESTLSGFAAYSAGSVNLADGESAMRVGALGVTPDFLGVLGVEPTVGRGFRPAEGGPGAGSVAILTHDVWMEQFGGSRRVLQDGVTLNGEPVPVVGVLPPDFWFLGNPGILVPLRLDPSSAGRGSRRLEGLARLDDGIEVATAQTDLRGIFARLETEYPASNEGWTVRVLPLSEYALARNGQAFRLLAGAALLVLLVGCVNVANLMLVRSERRQKEIAVRAAMGAGRRRLGRQFLGEALMLASVGAGLGVLLAWAGSNALVAFWGTSLPRSADVRLTAPVVAFTIGVSFLSALLVAAIPIAQVRMARLYDTLREGSISARGSSRRMQKALVTAEVALAVLLVTGAGLLLRSAWKAGQIDAGVNLDRALAFRVQLPERGYPEPSDGTEYFRRAVAEIGRIPGVRAVGITDRTPLQGGYNITTLTSPVDPELESSFVEVRRVTPDFFRAAGIPLLRGRLLTEADGTTGAEVVVISEKLSQDLFPGGDPIGQRVDPGWNETGYEVVGVVGSVREFGLLRDERPALYWPYPVAGAPSNMTFVVRTEAESPMEVMPQIRAVMGSIDPTVPLYGVATLQDVALQTLGSRRLATNLFAAFGLMALLLAGVGVFSVLAYSVEQRTREIGIRIAVGAGEERVTRHVVAQGVRLVVLGLIMGGVGAYLGGRLLSQLLYEVEPNDALTLSAVLVVVLVSALVASWLPARRAARVNPSVALRSE